MNELSITAICRLLESGGNRLLAATSATLLEHALQTPWLAERAAPRPSSVSACLLHDQGGAFSAAEARAFIEEPDAVDAVKLRPWDGQARRHGVSTPSLAHFALTLRRCALSAAAPRS